MRGSSQKKIGITEADTITMTKVWINIISNADTKHIHRNISGKRIV
jgi:hypothetical protein